MKELEHLTCKKRLREMRDEPGEEKAQVGNLPMHINTRWEGVMRGSQSLLSGAQ